MNDKIISQANGALFGHMPNTKPNQPASRATIGTVLPNAKTFQINDDYAKTQARLNGIFGANDPALSRCGKRLVAGELRYYSDATHYAVVSGQKARWFECRADGHDYALGPNYKPAV